MLTLNTPPWPPKTHNPPCNTACHPWPYPEASWIFNHSHPSFPFSSSPPPYPLYNPLHLDPSCTPPPHFLNTSTLPNPCLPLLTSLHPCTFSTLPANHTCSLPPHHLTITHFHHSLTHFTALIISHSPQAPLSYVHPYLIYVSPSQVHFHPHLTYIPIPLKSPSP